MELTPMDWRIASEYALGLGYRLSQLTSGVFELSRIEDGKTVGTFNHFAGLCIWLGISQRVWLEDGKR